MWEHGVAWIALGAAFAAVYYLGKKDEDVTARVPWGHIVAISLFWPPVVIGGFWCMAADYLKQHRHR